MTRTITTAHGRRALRRARVRARVAGTSKRPRLVVFKSNKALYAQVIDDTKGHTLAAADTRGLEGANATQRATALGTLIGERAKTAGVEQVVFDRGGYRYHGVIAACADAARKAGLTF